MDQVGEDALVTCNNVLNRLVAAETHVVGVAACLFNNKVARRSGIRSKGCKGVGRVAKWIEAGRGNRILERRTVEKK